MAVCQCRFYSDVLEKMCSAHVILPEGPDLPERFPVLWLLHGLSDDDSTWCRRTAIERHVSGLPLAVVMPDGGRSFYSDMAAGPKYWTFLSEELPAVMRRYFPLSDKREENFAGGNSMGGYGGVKLALRHPDRYSAAITLSGALDMAAWPEHQRDNESNMAMFRSVWGTVERMRENGDDLMCEVENAASRGPLPRIFQACGTEDFLWADNLRFRDAAEKAGLDVTMVSAPGGHDWDFWDEHIAQGIRWLGLK